MASPYATGNEVVDQNATNAVLGAYNPYGGRNGGSNPSYDASIYSAVADGSYYGTPAAAPAVDPYAQWGGKGAYDAKVNQFNSGRQSVYDSANANADNKGIMLGRGIRDSLEAIRSGQAGLDTKAAKNELAKMQGQAGIMGMVGRGIKSSGVMLGNRNAGDSSAVEGLAGAYGQMGQQQMAGVGNQYEMGNMDIANEQTTLNRKRDNYQQDYAGDKQVYVNDIISQADQAFQALNADMTEASLPQRIAIEQEKETIRQQVLSKLQAYDQQLSSGLAGINPQSADQRRTQAIGLRDAGTNLGADAFNFTDQAPVNFQGNAPSGGNLPLYTLPRKRLA